MCEFCQHRARFRFFSNYVVHMEKCHGLYYCDLCTDNCKVWFLCVFKLFTHERRNYTRQDLARHRSEGYDCAEQNIPLHPSCKICHKRFFDSNALYSHQKLDHHYCPLCPETFVFFRDLPDLDNHLDSTHFVCRIDMCYYQRPLNAFSTEVELNLHIASQHCSGDCTRNYVDFITTPPNPNSGENTEDLSEFAFFSELRVDPLTVSRRNMPRGFWASRLGRIPKKNIYSNVFGPTPPPPRPRVSANTPSTEEDEKAQWPEVIKPKPAKGVWGKQRTNGEKKEEKETDSNVRSVLGLDDAPAESRPRTVWNREGYTGPKIYPKSVTPWTRKPKN
ncbi:E3 ubiquitin-protein ligase ZNF598-like [Octopus sinensis]|uniref:E3 ubiquitin-protein ligase ZNF598-like n=1 Tax=Octopus sinensis TaxID=2607531 RepID=A0A6P7U0Q0_9MOLL|nr:E3 ubiquitin-protein ligase ZNF598-like [Octopus sinensis]XP_029657340.2 E3 ubiquitin-protein ligase ZNF598-like [Octopus sinensis]